MTKSEKQWPQPYLRGGNDTRYRFTMRRASDIGSAEAVVHGAHTEADAKEWAQEQADLDGENWVVSDWATAASSVVGPK